MKQDDNDQNHKKESTPVVDKRPNGKSQFKTRTPPVSPTASTARIGRCHDWITLASITFNETLNDFFNNASFNLHFEWQKHKNSTVNQFIIEGRTTKPEFL